MTHTQLEAPMKSTTAPTLNATYHFMTHLPLGRTTLVHGDLSLIVTDIHQLSPHERSLIAAINQDSDFHMRYDGRTLFLAPGNKNSLPIPYSRARVTADGVNGARMETTYAGHQATLDVGNLEMPGTRFWRSI